MINDTAITNVNFVNDTAVEVDARPEWNFNSIAAKFSHIFIFLFCKTNSFYDKFATFPPHPRLLSIIPQLLNSKIL